MLELHHFRIQAAAYIRAYHSQARRTAHFRLHYFRPLRQGIFEACRLCTGRWPRLPHATPAAAFTSHTSRALAPASCLSRAGRCRRHIAGNFITHDISLSHRLLRPPKLAKCARAFFEQKEALKRRWLSASALSADISRAVAQRGRLATAADIRHAVPSPRKRVLRRQCRVAAHALARHIFVNISLVLSFPGTITTLYWARELRRPSQSKFLRARGA